MISSLLIFKYSVLTRKVKQIYMDIKNLIPAYQNPEIKYCYINLIKFKDSPIFYLVFK
jgi:hypothetical protein